MNDVAERSEEDHCRTLGRRDRKVVENASFIDDLGADSLAVPNL